MTATQSAGAFFLAWIAIIGGLWLITKTDWGRVITTYVLWSLVTFMILIHAQDITTLLLPSGILAPSGIVSGSVS